jgi:hypothetical protein
LISGNALAAELEPAREIAGIKAVQHAVPITRSPRCYAPISTPPASPGTARAGSFAKHAGIREFAI